MALVVDRVAVKLSPEVRNDRVINDPELEMVYIEDVFLFLDLYDIICYFYKDIHRIILGLLPQRS